VRLDPTTWRQRGEQYLARDLWRAPVPEEPFGRIRRSALQLLVIVGEGFSRDRLMLRASALTYFAMLSLIPILAVAIGMLHALIAMGVLPGEDLSVWLANQVVDRVAAGSPAAKEQIVSLVTGVHFGSLGAVGAATLFVTAVLGLGNIEGAFNSIWGIERKRPPMRRFSDYLAVLVVAPLLVTLAVSLATSLHSQKVLHGIPGLSGAYQGGLRIAPTLLLWLGFSFLYWFLPNTTVRPGAALLGGLVAALLFGLAQAFYIGFNVGVARANALFGSFAALPLLLVWIYVSWIVVLLGCEVAFASHSLERLRLARTGDDPKPAAREVLGLAVAADVARAFRRGEGITAERVAKQIDVPVRSVRSILGDLEAAGIVAPRGGESLDVYQLGRAADEIPLGAVRDAMRGRVDLPDVAVSAFGPVRALVAEIEHGVAEVLGARTLADLESKLPAPDPARRG
jgi:membrane protein